MTVTTACRDSSLPQGYRDKLAGSCSSCVVHLCTSGALLGSFLGACDVVTMTAPDAKPQARWSLVSNEGTRYPIESLIGYV